VPARGRELPRTVPADRRELAGRVPPGCELAAGIVGRRHPGTCAPGRPRRIRRHGNAPGAARRGPRRARRPGRDRRRNSCGGRRKRRHSRRIAGLRDGRRRRGGPATTPATADQPATMTRLSLGIVRAIRPGKARRLRTGKATRLRTGKAARLRCRRTHPASRLPRPGLSLPLRRGRIGRKSGIAGVGRMRGTDRPRRPTGLVPPAARSDLGIRQGLVARPRRPPARLAGLALTGSRARADRRALGLRRTQIVEPAGLLLRNLLRLDRLRARTPEQPPAPPGGLLVALLSVVVGPFGTARSHGCWSSPAARPPWSSVALSVGGPSDDGPPPRTMRRSRGSRSATARSAPWSVGW
jgi:hypothetical protein